jgi:hypothetical protein
MKTNRTIAGWLTLLVLSILNLQLSTCFAQGTAFTYQGRLNDGANPAGGIYDLRFTIYDAATNGNTVSGVLTNAATAVSNGLFTVTLDFGSGVFYGANYWLDIGVRTNGPGAFTTLTPRQALTPTPYAIYSATAGTALTAATANGIGNLNAANIAQLNVLGTAAQATGVPVVFNGFIVGANVISGGAGYVTPPIMTVDDSTGSGAVVTANILGGAVVSFTVQNAGHGYSSGATLTAGLPPSNAYQTFLGANYFTGVNTMTNLNNVFAGTYTGNGGGLTNLNAANLTGTAGTATNFAGSLSGNVTGTQNATVVASVGGQSAANVAAGASAANAATSAATASSIVKRDATASFSATNLTLKGNLNLPAATTNAGIIYSGNNKLLHTFGIQCFYAGLGAGNLSTTETAGNTAIGNQAMANNTNGGYNTVAGVAALYSNTSGSANTVNGVSAMYKNTTGSGNVAIGYGALSSSTNGSSNTAIGADALYNATSGSWNIALGNGAGYSLTTGEGNIYIGSQGVEDETNVTRIGDWQSQTFIGGVIHGDGSGLVNLNVTNLTGTFSPGQLGGSVNAAVYFTGNLNGEVGGTQNATFISSVGGLNATLIASGADAANNATRDNAAGTIVRRDGSGSFSVGSVTFAGNLYLPETSSTAGIIFFGGNPLMHAYGAYNFFAGGYAGNFAMSGSGNSGVGFQALHSNASGYGNTAHGYAALNANTAGAYNTAMGYQVLPSNSNGLNNTASGANALYHNDSGSFNTANGSSALYYNMSGSHNTANGYLALFNTTGNNNVALGDSAGKNITTGDYNIDIGNQGVATDTNIIRIGVQGTQTSAYIAGISGTTAASGVAVYVNSSGQLGTLTSSRKYKQDIRNMDGASEALLALQPVTFRYQPDIDPQNIPQFGLVAEEVEKVNPDLVAHDNQGRPYTVRYEAVNAMLLNEFLKEHKKVAAQNTEIQDLKARLEKLEQFLNARNGGAK